VMRLTDSQLPITEKQEIKTFLDKTSEFSLVFFCITVYKKK